MSPRLHQSPRPRRPAALLGTLVLTAALAATTAGCGSDDDPSTTSSTATTTASTTATTGPTTTDAPGSGGTAGAPADGEAAIRAALGRGAASSAKAKTARMALTIDVGPTKSTATGTVDLVGMRSALDQTVETGGRSTRLKAYGEKDKAYIQPPGSSDWYVTDNPVGSSDPLSQVRQLQKATITAVRETETIGGHECRWFDAKVKVADAIENVRDPTAQQLMRSAPKGAAIPLSACVDDQGLTYRIEEDYEPSKTLGPAAAAAPRTRISIRISDYGTAPAPERPAGVEDAKPLSQLTRSSATAG